MGKMELLKFMYSGFYCLRGIVGRYVKAGLKHNRTFVAPRRYLMHRDTGLLLACGDHCFMDGEA